MKPTGRAFGSRRCVIAVLALTLASCGQDAPESGARVTPSTITLDPTTTVPALATSTTLTSGTTTTQVPATTAVPSAGGVRLTAAGAKLTAPASRIVQSTAGPSADCQALADSGWTSECERVQTAAGTVVWLVERRSVGVGSQQAWQAMVLRFDSASATWLAEVFFKDETGNSLASVKAKSADLTGDGKPEIVVGFRMAGSGAYLVYDIVSTDTGGTARVAASRGIARGQVSVADGVLTEYEAKYPNGEGPNFPAHFEKSTVTGSGSSFNLSPAGQVPAPGPGQLDL